MTLRARSIAALAGGVLLALGAFAADDRDMSAPAAAAPARPTIAPAAARAAGARALTMVAVPERLGYALRFVPRAPGDPRAATDRDRDLITLYVAAGEPVHRLAHDLGHELGHAYDDVRMTDAARRAYLARRGVPEAAWWPGGEWSDYASGAGDFAEVFAACRAASPEFRSELAPRPEDPCALLPAAAGEAA